MAFVRIGLLAAVVTALAGGIWTGLLVANLATTPAVPWSVLLTAILLAAAWRVSRGTWSLRSTADGSRARVLRANPVSREVLGWSLVAGALAIVALVGLWIVVVQVAGAPDRSLPDYSPYPPLTVSLVIAMSGLVGAVAEEAMFRGFFQGSLERVIGGPAAIATTCLVMAPEHALTQGFVWSTLVFYLAVDAVFGLTAFVTNSILPGIILHAAGLAVFFAFVWPGDPGYRPIGDGGADLWFCLHAGQIIAFGLLALFAFRHLAKVARD